MKEKLTSEEILKLPKEEFINYMKESKKDLYHINFMNSLPKNYEKLSIDKKINYWSEVLNQGMRFQVEKGFDEYLVFSYEWYESFKSIDENVDYIMNEVFNTFLKFGWPWKKEEYLKRIPKPSL